MSTTLPRGDRRRRTDRRQLRTLPTRYLGLPGDRRGRRLVQLYAGLILFGVSMAMMVRARLGLPPWDVLHQGIADRSGIGFGWIVIAASAVVLLLWLPLHQRPGVGTLSNLILVGLAAQVTLDLVGRVEPLGVRIALLSCGVLMNAIASGMYIGAGLGPGPRDGLMTGLAAPGHSLRVVRTTLEIVVLAIGWSLGGTVGIGTLAFAISIGPLVHQLLPRFTISARDSITRGSCTCLAFT